MGIKMEDAIGICKKNVSGSRLFIESITCSN